jgi:alpha-D-ribose 1-methylphosphonate 5-triphosphate diphosphatase PhnM
MNDRGELAIGQLGDLVQVHELTGRPVLRAAWRGAMRIA